MLMGIRFGYIFSRFSQLNIQQVQVQFKTKNFIQRIKISIKLNSYYCVSVVYNLMNLKKIP